MIDNNLIKAYSATLYRVNGFMNPIIIGRLSGELDNLLHETRTVYWTYITAYNPMSERRSEPENERCNSLLRQDLKDYKILEGIGESPDGDWEGEKSFLVLGISKKDAKRLGKKYKQHAIVYGKIGAKAELCILESSCLSGKETLFIKEV